jgi:fumarate reductase subunit C
MRNSEFNTQFVRGFISAFVLLAGVALLSKLTVWFRRHPQPEDFIEFLTTPVLSILHIFTGLIWLLVLFVLLNALAWLQGP